MSVEVKNESISVLMVDDEVDSQEVLDLMLQQLEFPVDIVSRCSSAEEAISGIQKHRPDLVFLDIEMPGKNGFEVLKAFEDPNFQVIIVTGYEQYALRAIKFAALDYLLKPIELGELKHALEKVIKHRQQDDPRMRHLSEMLRKNKPSNDKIVLPGHNGFRTLKLNEIVYLESKPGSYCVFHLKGGQTTIVTKPLSYFEDILPEESFFRIHRSYMINFEYVQNYHSSGRLKLVDGTELEVSVRRRSEFLNSYKNYLS